jgi:ribonucleoside-diphosphate reductase alpha chain
MKDKMSEIATKPKETTDVMSPWAHGTFARKYAFKDENGNPIENWNDTATRVVTNVLRALGYNEDSYEVRKLIEFTSQRKFMPGGRYLYASGRPLHQTQNCLLLKAEDSREGWAELSYKAAMALMTGAGIGVVYSDVREKGAPISKTGGEASGPLSLMDVVNEQGRNYMQGGSRRSAIWAGLHWWHPDVFDFIKIKDWPPELRALKEKDYNFRLPMELTNISVILDREFFFAFEDENHPQHDHAVDVYWKTLRRMLKTGEPGFSIDYDNPAESLRNACTEISSEDDSDICNLGSINLARVESLEEMEELTQLGTLFLLAGTVYSHVPYDKVDETRSKNRRLGLGTMGHHEFLLKRGKKYGADSELAEYLEIYARSGYYAAVYADRHQLSRPIKTRAIAPTGTIGILAETTTGIEPIFCVAYKRRYLDGQLWKYQYVVDPTTERLVEQGIDPDQIEDCYTLAMDVERRVAFQAWVQQYVDHGISSTINLAYPITDKQEVDEFGKMLYRYLPKLRGITVYPDGARGGQPLTIASYHEAIKHPGVVFEENEERCSSGSCGV